ncbi:MAG: hypothetical protein AAGH99_09425 [Planctomycetota bacterium]
MTQRSLAVLIVLNVVLLAALSVTVFNPEPADAQGFGVNRQYTMIAGQTTGRNSQDVVYIIDLATSRIAPVFYNGNSEEFEFFSGRSVADDMRQIGRGR